VIRSMTAGALIALAATVSAQTPPPATAVPLSSAEEQAVRSALNKSFNITPTSITRTSFGWYEVAAGGSLAYVDPTLRLLFNGSVIDMATKQNLTEARRNELLRVDYAALPLQQAIKLVFGDGKRQFVTFEDPRCGFCKRLHRDSMRDLTDATVYVFLYPILSADSTAKARAIWCSKDRVAAWTAWITKDVVPAAPPEDCAAPIEQNVALGRRLGITGTPTIIFQDGSRLPGAADGKAIEARLSAAATARAAR
jgi:thiol:disulfide interchange protein DsbC